MAESAGLCQAPRRPLPSGSPPARPARSAEPSPTPRCGRHCASRGWVP